MQDLSFKELVCSVAEPMFIERLLSLKRSPPTAVDARASHSQPHPGFALTRGSPPHVKPAGSRTLPARPAGAGGARSEAAASRGLFCAVCKAAALHRAQRCSFRRTHVPKLIKAARCVHVLSHGHAVSVTVCSMLCVSFPCAAKLVQLSTHMLKLVVVCVRTNNIVSSCF